MGIRLGSVFVLRVEIMKRCHEQFERPQDFQLECRVKNIIIIIIISIVVHLCLITPALNLLGGW